MTSTTPPESTRTAGSSAPEAHWSSSLILRIGAISGLVVVSALLLLVIRLLASPATPFFVALLFISLMVAGQLLVALFARPFTTDDAEARELDGLRVVVLVPCYNEDAALLEESLRSMLHQTRLPSAISVIDDGSLIDYSVVETSVRTAAEACGIELHWKRTENHGKRYALINAARQEPDADIYMTVDSDSILDRAAIAEGLKPFADERIQSVAGFLLVLNYSEGWLARMMELLIVSWGLLERSALSVTGSVLVNSGACALYRAEIVRENAADFLSETILGRPMAFSDDSLLTLFALERGRAVQQPTSFAFSRMPTAVRPHLVQQARWMRGAIIRAWWRFKYLPLNSIAYWVLALKWLQFFISTLVFVFVAYLLLTTGPFNAFLFGLGWLTMQLAISSRYLALRRSDQTRRQRWGVYAMVPVMIVWQAIVLHPLRFYAYATFARTGWGSRKS